MEALAPCVVHDQPGRGRFAAPQRFSLFPLRHLRRRQEIVPAEGSFCQESASVIIVQGYELSERSIWPSTLVFVYVRSSLRLASGELRRQQRARA